MPLTAPERRIRRYGFRPSLPRFGEPIANTDQIRLRKEVDNRDVLGPLVENQWALGSCTANATATDFRFDAIKDGNDPGQLCRFQIYWGERKLEGTLGQGDTGAMGHDAFVVAQSGLALETEWPYQWPGMEEDQPPDDSVFDPADLPQAVVENETAYKLAKPVAAVPQSQRQIMAVLSNDQTVSFGFTVYESFESSEVANTGIVPMPGQDENVLGGHEVLACGYLRSEPNYVLCMNSWGTGWGLKGFFLMPWSYICDPQLATDLRTIVRPLAQ
jgi:C1A family cysteine protease